MESLRIAFSGTDIRERKAANPGISSGRNKAARRLGMAAALLLSCCWASLQAQPLPDGSYAGTHAGTDPGNPDSLYTNPLPVPVGDPFVLCASDGLYYLYGTGGGAKNGFAVYVSH